MLSDLIKPRVVQLGCIKIGQKGAERTTKDGQRTYRMPEKLDHFLLTTMNRDKTGQLVRDELAMKQLAKEGYADQDGQIRRLPIHLLSDDIEDVIQATYVYYAGKKCAMRSDGKTTTWFVNPDKPGEWLKDPIAEAWRPELLDWRDKNNNPMVKLHTTFNCVIRSQGSRFGGVHRFRTTSRITAEQLYGGLTSVLSFTGGVLVGIPLQLVVRPMQVSPDGKTTNVYVVHCEVPGADLKKIQEQALDQIRFRLAYQKEVGHSLVEYRKLLAAPGFETDPAEIADVAEEFQPEEPEREPVSMPRAIDEPPPEEPEKPEPSVKTPDEQEPVDPFAIEKAAWHHRLSQAETPTDFTLLVGEGPREPKELKETGWAMQIEAASVKGFVWDKKSKTFVLQE